MQEWILAQDGVTLYLSLFLMLLGGVVGLPIPEDIPLILGGILVHIGKCSLLPVFAVCYLTVVVGDIIIFSIGSYFGTKLFKTRWFNNRETRMKLKRIRVGIERRSIIMIFLARHLFYVRTLTFLSCGALKMKFSRFVIADAIAALISVPLMIGLGYFMAGSFEQLSQILDQAKALSLIALIVGVAGYVTFKLFKRMTGEDSPAETDSES